MRSKVWKGLELYPSSLENYINFKSKYPGGVFYFILESRDYLDPDPHCIPTFIVKKKDLNLNKLFNDNEIDIIYNNIKSN